MKKFIKDTHKIISWLELLNFYIWFSFDVAMSLIIYLAIGLQIIYLVVHSA